MKLTVEPIGPDKFLPRRRAIILTALPLEYVAARAHVSMCQELFHGGVALERGIFSGRNAEWEVLLAQTGKGNDSSAIQAALAAAAFRPDVALFVGICGGMKDAKLGDVIVAERVYLYGAGVEGDEFFSRPNAPEASQRLLWTARALTYRGDWKTRAQPSIDERASVWIGPLVATPSVVKSRDSELYRRVTSEYNDAVAIEMEGYGFYRALTAFPTVERAVVRGVSDSLADKSAQHDAIWQPRAAAAAAAAAFQLLFDCDPEAAARPNEPVLSSGSALELEFWLNREYDDQQAKLAIAAASSATGADARTISTRMHRNSMQQWQLVIRIPMPYEEAEKLSTLFAEGIRELDIPHSEGRYAKMTLQRPRVPHEMAARSQEYAVVHCRGEFDTYYCAMLQQEIEGLAGAGVKYVVLNLRLVKFANSTALGAIVKASRYLSKCGGALVISRPSPFMKEILEKVGVDRVVRMFISDVEAMFGVHDRIMYLSRREEDFGLKGLSFSEEGVDLSASRKGSARIVQFEEGRIVFQTRDSDSSGSHSWLALGACLQLRFHIPLMDPRQVNVRGTIQSIQDVGTVRTTTVVLGDVAPDVNALMMEYFEGVRDLKNELRTAVGELEDENR